MSTETIHSVKALPAKDFFVTMLTRDIELEDAILDLLDNCVDGAIRTRTKKQHEEDTLEGFWAKITFNDKQFVIKDNCGGIPWKLAKDYAFRMGRPDDVDSKEGTIGVVGIGMKRAIFKMGRCCKVLSDHKDDTFVVEVPPAWFDDDKLWSFDASRRKPSLQDHGTVVEVSELIQDTRIAFRQGSSFRETFPAKVGDAYSYLIEKGFKITINGQTVRSRPVRLFFEEFRRVRSKDEAIRPFVYSAKIREVDVFMAVGYRAPLRTEEEQENEADASFAAKEAGWTIVCNDRVVLSNDRSLQTGWGFNGVPNFHNQFSCIAGIVDFHSANTADLPVTTTKRGIDTGKDVYVLVRQKMQEGLKHFTRNTNRWKTFEKELKSRFAKPDFFLGLNALKSLDLPMHGIPGDGQHKQFKPNLPVKERIETTRRISFRKELKDIETVSGFLFDEIRTADEVGETCFDRFLKEAIK